MGRESHLIASTPNRGLRPAGTPGQRDHGLLTRILHVHLSEAHGRLFAEPVPSPDGRATDWYVEDDVAVARLEELPVERQAGLRARLGSLQADILRLADELEATGRPEQRIQAEMLRIALEVPDPAERYVRQVGDAPVLIGWGLVSDVPDPPTGVLTTWIRAKAAQPAGVGETAPAPSETPSPSTGMMSAPAVEAAAATQRRFWWASPLLWLLFALLTLWVSWLMLIGCELSLPLGMRLPWTDRCTAVAGSAPDLRHEVEAQRVLETEIAELEREVARQRALCRAGGETPRRQASAADEEAPNGEQAGLEERLEREHARSGAVQVSLIWDSLADLDLAVVCPSGERISFEQRVACGGELQVDMNAREPSSPEPVEHVIWAEGAAKPGSYRVEVTVFRPDPDTRAEIPYEVHVKRGDEDEVHRGSIASSPRRPASVTTFNLR